MAKIMTVLTGTAPGALVPLVLAKALKAGGTAMVDGLTNEKKRTLEPFCW